MKKLCTKRGRNNLKLFQEKKGINTHTLTWTLKYLHSAHFCPLLVLFFFLSCVFIGFNLFLLDVIMIICSLCLKF